MKKQILIFVMVFSCIFFFYRLIALPKESDAITKILEAAECFGLAGSGENGKKGFFLLLDAIILAAPDTSYSDEFRMKIKTANDILRENSIFERKGTDLLREAYQLINSSQEFQFPEEISNMGDAVRYAHKKLNGAAKELKEGDADSAEKSLLEVAIMVVTPVHQEH